MHPMAGAVEPQRPFRNGCQDATAHCPQRRHRVTSSAKGDSAMAKRKAPRKKPETSSVLSRAQGNLKKLQGDAEAVLSRRRNEFKRLVTRTSKDLESALNCGLDACWLSTLPGSNW